MKFGGSVEGSVARRQELEADIDGPLEHTGQVPAGEIRERLQQLLPRDCALITRVTVDMMRSTRLLDIDDTLVELAVDDALIRNGDRQAFIE